MGLGNRIILSRVLVMGLLGLSAFAKSADVTLEEVVVTAQKRTENMQNVPIAIQSVSRQELTAGGVQSLVNLPQLAPSLTIEDNAYLLPFIRGVGSTDSGTGIYSSVAIYLDGVYLPRLTSALDDLDAEQIEILKGPQGSLYGRNATGGAILITTRSPRPGDAFKGNVEVGAGNYHRKDVKAFVSGSLTSTLAGTLSACLHKHDGWEKNLGGVKTDNGDSEDAYCVNGKLVFEPTDRLSVRLSANFDRSKGTNVLYQELATGDSPKIFAPFGIVDHLNGGQSLAAGLLLAFTLPALGPHPAFPAIQGLANKIISVTQGIQFSNQIGESYDNQINGWNNGLLAGQRPVGSYRDLYTQLYSLSARYKFDPFDLVSLTSYGRHTLYGGTEVLNANPTTADFTSLGFPGKNIGLSASDVSHSFSQDLYLTSADNSKINWTTGLYYFTEQGTAINSLDIFGLSTLSGDADWKVESAAAYGQITYPLTTHWNATAGTRYTEEKYTLEDRLDPASPFNLLGLQNTGDRQKKSTRSTANGKIDYHTDNWLAYGMVSTGFKSGGLNPQSALSAPVEPEDITAYELGWKSEWFDHHLRLNGSVYHYKYEHIQVTAYDASSGSNFSVSAPLAHINGADLDFALAAQQGTTIFGGVTWLDAKFKGNTPITVGTGTTFIATDGNHMPFAPDFKASVGLTYALPMVQRLDFTGTVQYDSGYWLEISNRVGTGGSGSAASVTTANLNLKYTSPSDRWYASAWANNVFDKKYFQSGIVVSGLGESGVAGIPRNYGVTLGMNF
jgi:iron complex outermembrane recepter protein